MATKKVWAHCHVQYLHTHLWCNPLLSDPVFIFKTLPGIFSRVNMLHMMCVKLRKHSQAKHVCEWYFGICCLQAYYHLKDF